MESPASNTTSHLNIPDTAVGKSLRLFIEAQYKKDASLMEGLFSEDAVFDGLLYKLQGGAMFVPVYNDFLTKFYISYRVDSVAPAPDNWWICLTFVDLTDTEKEIGIVDLVKFDEHGKICRINNCFDTTKVGRGVAKDACEQKE